jgi:hypothetical protein
MVVSGGRASGSDSGGIHARNALAIRERDPQLAVNERDGIGDG